MRLLIIEDSPDMILVLKDELAEKIKCELTISQSGNEGIEILKGVRDFDVIICDYQMKNGDGLDVLNFLNNQQINIPFIFFSGMAEALKQYESGICKAVIQKPDIATLKKTIAKVVSQ